MIKSQNVHQALAQRAYFGAGALHDALGDYEHLVDDLGRLVGSQRDEQDTEVRSAKIKRQDVVRFVARRHVANIGRNHFQLGLGVC